MKKYTQPYPDRPQTLFPLNQGEDCLMVDWTGSMSLPYAVHGRHAWWRKAGRLFGGSFRLELPLIRPGLLVVNPEGLEFAARSGQSFDPLSGVLSTRLYLSETVLEIESLMWNGCFVRSVRVVRTVPGAELVFTLNDRRLWAKTGPECAPYEPWEYFARDGAAGFRYHHEPDQENVQHGAVPAFTGTGYSLAWRDNGAPGRAVRDYSCPRYLHGRNSSIVFAGLRPGDRFCCAVALRDTMSPCGSGHAAEARGAVAAVREAGFDKIRRATSAYWRGVQSRSRIHLGGLPAADHFFQLSTYALHASQHPGGSIPCTADLGDLSASAYWDTWGPGGAFVRLNHMEAGRCLGNFWVDCLPEARRQAALLGAAGARLAWTSAPAPKQGYCSRFPMPQYHNIGVAVNSAWEGYVYDPDPLYLERIYPLVAESSLFLSSWLLERHGGKYRARAVGSLDENPQDRVNDSWTLASALRTLEIHGKVCALLGRPQPEFETKARDILAGLLRANVRKNGLCAYPGARRQSLGSILPYRFHPGLPAFDASWRRYVADSRESEGLGLGPYTHARARIFPWIQAKAAAVLAAKRRPGIWSHWLSPLLAHTDCWGGSPELWLHQREFSMSWYLGSHGFYLLTLAELFAAGSPRTGFDLLWGLDPAWENVEFEGVRLPGGFSVSGGVSRGRVGSLILRNVSADPLHPPTLRYPARPGGKLRSVKPPVLRPGEKFRLV